MSVKFSAFYSYRKLCFMYVASLLELSFTSLQTAVHGCAHSCSVRSKRFLSWRKHRDF
jgi:hypothetical protein